MPSRRQVLGLAVAAVPTVVGIRFLQGTEQRSIVTVLRAHLGYLKLDPAGLENFARDLVAHGKIATGKLRLAGALGLLRHHFTPDYALGRTLMHGEERIVNYYLLSSDFFSNGADQSRTVSYLGFYDPLARPCANPFPALVRDAAEAGLKPV